MSQSVTLSGPSLVYTGQLVNITVDNTSSSTVSIQLYISQSFNFGIGGLINLNPSESTTVPITIPIGIVGDINFTGQDSGGSTIPVIPFASGIVSFLVTETDFCGDSAQSLRIALPNSFAINPLLEPGSLSLTDGNNVPVSLCDTVPTLILSSPPDTYSTIYYIACNGIPIQPSYPHPGFYSLQATITNNSFVSISPTMQIQIICIEEVPSLRCGDPIPIRLSMPTVPVLTSLTLYDSEGNPTACSNPTFFADSPPTSTLYNTYNITCDDQPLISSTEPGFFILSVSLEINGVGIGRVIRFYTLCQTNECGSGIQLQFPIHNDEYPDVTFTELSIAPETGGEAISCVPSYVNGLLSCTDINDTTQPLPAGNYLLIAKGITNYDGKTIYYSARITITGDCHPPLPPMIIALRSTPTGSKAKVSIVNLPSGVTVISMQVNGVSIQVGDDQPLGYLYAVTPGDYIVNAILSNDETLSTTITFTGETSVNLLALDPTICLGEIASFTLEGIDDSANGTLQLQLSGDTVLCSGDVSSTFACPMTGELPVATYQVLANLSLVAVIADGFEIPVFPVLVGFGDNLFILGNCGATGGDPHVVCLDNSRLEIYEPGYYRLFDNLREIQQALVILNVEVIRFGDNKEDMYRHLYCKFPDQELVVKFQDSGLVICQKGTQVRVGNDWEYTYNTPTGEFYQILVSKTMNTIALKLKEKGEHAYGGALSGQVFKLPSLTDKQISPANVCYINRYIQNSVLCGSAQPHVITLNKDNLAVTPGCHRFCQIGDMLVNIHLREDLLLSSVKVYRGSELVKTWKWTGDKHWERTGSDESYETLQFLLRVQSNGSMSLALKVPATVSGLVANQTSRILSINDRSSLAVPTLATLPIQRLPAITLYQQLIEV